MMKSSHLRIAIIFSCVCASSLSQAGSISVPKKPDLSVAASKAKSKIALSSKSTKMQTGRKPASAATYSYDLVYRDIKLCGRIYSFPEIKSQNADLQLLFEDQILPQIQIRINLPGKIRSSTVSDTQTFYKDGPTAPPPHDLLLILPITSDDPLLQTRYCDQLRTVKKYFSRSKSRAARPVIRTRLVELKQVASATRGARRSTQIGFDLNEKFEIKAQLDPPIDKTTVSAPEASSFGRFWPVTSSTPSPRVDHVVIATKDYFAEAQALSQSRIQSGLGSRAINLEQIPGMQPGDPVPAQCQGAYFDECYLSENKVPTGVSFAASTSLAGMRSWNDMDGPGYRKIGDAAGLVRAYLRSLKIEHPELKYVVLMGDLFQLPPRFTAQNSYYSGPNEAPNFLSTDYYYSDLFSIWVSSNSVSYSGLNSTGWPCGDECAKPNTNWDTTAFRWSISYPFARTMGDPLYNNSNSVSQRARAFANIVSVGRIVAKPAIGQAKDTAVAHYVEKLIRWDDHPGERSQFTIVSADGVYVRRNLQEFEDKLGPFRYFGEGFGTSYVTAANRPSDFSTTDCIHHPPANDWHSYPLTTNYYGDELYLYQSEPKQCAPVDPAANWTRLPSPAEVTQEVSRTGFTFLFHSAHAGYAGIGYQSDHNGYGEGRSFRNFNIRVNNGGNYTTASRPGFEDFANYREANGHANGFMISSGCSPSSYFGGLPAKPMFPNNGRSTGEYLVMLENAGAVGTYMNTDVGYFYSDPLFEMDLIQSIKKIGDKLVVPRFGDVTIDLLKTIVPNQEHIYQILNRVFLGDPSAKLFHKPRIFVELPAIPQGQETP